MITDLEKFRDAIENNNFFKMSYLKIKLTDACNLRCVGCEYWKLPKLNKLPFDVLEKTIVEARDIGAKSVHLSGGEPTTREDLPKIIELINDLGMIPRMVTNGTKLNNEYLDELVSVGLKGVTFSLDSSDENEHDVMRGRVGLYKKVLSNIRLASNYIKSGDLVVGINTVVSTLNYKHLPEIVGLAADLGVNWIRLSPLDKNQYSLLGINKSSPKLLSKENIVEYESSIKLKIQKKIKKTGQVVFPEDLDVFGVSNSGIDSAVDGDYAKGFYTNHICFSPFNHVTVFPDGSVMPCCKIPLKNGIIGNILKNNLKEIVLSSASNNYRKLVNEGNLAACKSCTMKLFDNSKQYKKFKDINYVPKIRQ